MNLDQKLQLSPGESVFLVNPPHELKLGLKEARKIELDTPVLVFVRDSKTLEASAEPAIQAAKNDKLSWIAYPKAGKLGTDLNRDKLLNLMKPYGIEAVRLVSIDDTWSAIRFRPARRK